MLKEWWNKEIFWLGEYTLTLSQLVTALVVFIATFIVSSFIRRALSSVASKRTHIHPAQIYVITRILHYIILATGILIAVSLLGVNVGKLTLVASALGIGIGLGLQGIVNNFVSGLILLLEKSVKVGDFIELNSGIAGEVLAIHMRATLVRTNDNVDILIPNSQLIGDSVTNWTHEDNIRRFRIPFGVAYGSDKNLVKQAVLEATHNVPHTLVSDVYKPNVFMTGFGDSSLDFVLAVWVNADQVKRPAGLFSDYLWAIDDAFRKYKIEIPFPQRDLHVRSSHVTYRLEDKRES
ncbi:Mechanosensitive channel MscK [Thalassocella blandensis]|nr:Mechanosensitive channel MscK [Thalassocella blandensis]